MTPIPESESEVPSEEDDSYVTQLNEEVSDIIKNIEDWDVNDYVAVRYDSMWYPGIITKVLESAYEVSCMEYVDKINLNNKFRWPKLKDEQLYELEELLLKLDVPLPALHSKRQQGQFTLNEEDFSDASDVLKMVLK